MDKLIQWHKNYYYKMLDKLNISSYQAAWASWLKGIVFGVIIMLLCGCGTYQLAPKDKCCDTDVVYLDEIKGDSVNIFTSLDFNTITLDFKPRFYRGSDWYWGRTYSYWGYRPLWMDFDFYFGSNYYSYYNPYYSYYRPWNYWDWYMRPWRPYNNWYQGPFNNPSYNVIYNASRRGSLTSNLNRSIANRIQADRIVNVNKRPVNNNAINTLISNYKPNNNNNYKPSNNNNIIVKPNNNWKPSNNNNYKPSNNYSRPSNNYSKPSSNYSRPSSNVISRPSSSPSRGGKINNR
tara:strand:- start:1007 stop:1879 length:873 start_codon:yes stop_codon:yes gene_type:complete